MSDISNAILFFVMAMAILATAAMQLFGGRFDFLDHSVPQATYDSFAEAFLTIFQVEGGMVCHSCYQQALPFLDYGDGQLYGPSV